MASKQSVSGGRSEVAKLVVSDGLQASLDAVLAASSTVSRQLTDEHHRIIGIARDRGVSWPAIAVIAKANGWPIADRNALARRHDEWLARGGAA